MYLLMPLAHNTNVICMVAIDEKLKVAYTQHEGLAHST